MAVRTQADGEEFVRRVALGELWDPNGISRLASAELLAEVPADRLANVIQRITSSLGRPVRIRGIRSQYSVYLGGSGVLFVPKYDVEADFEDGAAAVSIVLVRESGRWRIRQLRVSSDALEL